MANLESNLSSAEVRRIHGQKTAVKDRTYTDESGARYVGLSNGRLEKIHAVKGDVTEDLEESVVSTVGGKTATQISDTVNQAVTNTADIATLEATKADRCYVTAIQLAF